MAESGEEGRNCAVAETQRCLFCWHALCGPPGAECCPASQNFVHKHPEPMAIDLIDATRTRIVDEVFRFGTTREDWRVFVYHEQTASLLANLFTVTDVLSYDILVMQRLEAERKPASYSALYFVEIDSSVFSALKNDISKKVYRFYYVVTINKNPYARKLAQFENVQQKEFFLGYIPVEERLFTFERGKPENAARGISCILGRSFAVKYTDRCAVEAEAIYRSLPEKDTREDLVVVDRSLDVCTALLHYFTFQPMLADLRMESFERDDTLWTKVRHVHIAEINKILSNESRDIVGEVRMLENRDVDQKTLLNIVLQAPEKIKLKESLSTYLDLTDRLFDFYESDIKRVVDIEQALSTRVTKDGYKYGRSAEDAMAVFSDANVKKENKLRVFLLCALQYGLQKSEVEDLVAGGTFTRSEVQLASEIEKLGSAGSTRREKYKYDISRYVPTLHLLLERVISGKSGLKSIGDSRRELLSLRKSNFKFSQQQNRRVICVLFIDSVTWPEIQVVYEISQKHNVEVIVGAPKTTIASEFIRDLECGYFFPKRRGYF